MATVEERLGRLEGGYEHLATKADVERLAGSVNTAIGDMRAEVLDAKAEVIKWVAGIGVAILLAMVAIGVALTLAVLRGVQ